jgi:exodeoxyribonuclease V gamma subunit
VKTSFAWLGQTDPVKAEAAARKAYEGDGLTTDGERRESPALSRQFADYDALIAEETFADWCDALYKPLLEASWRSSTSEEARS